MCLIVINIYNTQLIAQPVKNCVEKNNHYRLVSTQQLIKMCHFSDAFQLCWQSSGS